MKRSRRVVDGQLGEGPEPPVPPVNQNDELWCMRAQWLTLPSRRVCRG